MKLVNKNCTLYLGIVYWEFLVQYFVSKQISGNNRKTELQKKIFFFSFQPLKTKLYLCTKLKKP